MSIDVVHVCYLNPTLVQLLIYLNGCELVFEVISDLPDSCCCFCDYGNDYDCVTFADDVHEKRSQNWICLKQKHMQHIILCHSTSTNLICVEPNVYANIHLSLIHI